MEKSRKYVVLNLVIMLIIGMAICSMPAHATSQASFSIPDGAVRQGDNFNVSVTFSGTENIGSVNATMSYDDLSVQFVSGDYATGGGGNVTIKGFPDTPSASLTVTMTFRALSEGSSKMNLTACSIFSDDGTSIGSPTAYGIITVAEGNTDGTVTTAETKESSVTETTTTTKQTATDPRTDEDGMPTQGVLTALTVDKGTLSPAFSWNVYEYTINVGYDVTNVEIEGTTASRSDYIWYTGTSECQVGENVRTITVTPVSGTATTYTIRIIRADESYRTTSATEKTVAESSGSSDESKADPLEQYKKILNPALVIILIVLIIALVVVIFWIRTKIMGESSKNKKNKK